MRKLPKHELRLGLAAGVLALAIFTAKPGLAQDRRHADDELPTSKKLSARVPGAPQSVNTFPANLVLSPDGRYAVTLNNGYGSRESGYKQSLAVLDLATNKITDYPDDRLDLDAHQSYFLGLAFSSDGRRLFASIGTLTEPKPNTKTNLGNGIAVYAFDAGKIAPEKFLPLALENVGAGKVAARYNKSVGADQMIPYPAGLEVVKGAKDRLLVAGNLSDEALLLDPDSGAILNRFDLSTQRIVPGSYPYAVAVARDGRRAYVSLWNASRIAELDLLENRVLAMIPVRRPVLHTAAGSHPTALLFSPDESRLYVTLANTDEIAVIATKTGEVLTYVSTRLPGQTLPGVTPVALAQNSDGTKLYVADAGANAVGVLDVAKIASDSAARASAIAPMGFIPTEWYPQALAVRGDELLVACGKGRSAGPSSAIAHPDGNGGNGKYAYIFELMRGSLARIDLKDVERNLASMTNEVVATNFGTSSDQRLPFPDGKSPIHHVIYIIKENRTYDQVLGDMKGGDGDPSLVMFGEDVTPNEHKIAREFGILDNFYDSGEVSGDGHNWSTAAIASDYLEKTIQVGYRNHEERTYDYEGEVANRFPLEDNMPDVNETGTGYIWSNVARHHLTYRHYGEFVATRWCGEDDAGQPARMATTSSSTGACERRVVKMGEPLPPNVGDPHGSPSPWPWPVPMIARDVPTKPELRGHFDPRFADFKTPYPDQLRVDEFLNEFNGFVRAGKGGKGAALPNYIMLRLPNDHTSGTYPGAATPAAAVADNDLAVGRVVEAVSTSPYWKDTAILILEDDSQDGPDHVDAHRSIAFLVSAYSPASEDKRLIERGFYTTVSMVRTLEALLGLPPMNQNDAEAPVIRSPFSGDGHHAAFHADFRNRDNGLIYKVNAPDAPGAAESLKMDFSDADRADNVKLNEILWRDRMGDRPMPPPQHHVFPAGTDSGANPNGR